MRSIRVAAAAAVVITFAAGQSAGAQTSDPMAGPLVAGAPFSADASTTVMQTLGDGTRIEQRVTAKFYRDGAGRVRREQTIIGLDALDPSAPPRTVITFDSVPGDPMPYTIDPVARTVRRMPRGQFLRTVTWPAGSVTSAAAAYGLAIRSDAANPDRQRELERAVNQLSLRLNGVAASQIGMPSPAPIPADVRPTEEDLGTRVIENVKATGRRTTFVIPQGRVGNDRAITVTDERWQSPELGLIVYSRYADPRTNVVEFRLTGITRTEPRAELFTVPADYTVIPQPGGIRIDGARVGGAAPAGGGGRGQRGAPPQP